MSRRRDTREHENAFQPLEWNQQLAGIFKRVPHREAQAGVRNRTSLRRACGFLEDRREELARAGRTADMQAAAAFIHEAQVAVPSEIVEHEAQALHLARRQVGVVDVEHLP